MNIKKLFGAIMSIILVIMLCFIPTSCTFDLGGDKEEGDGNNDAGTNGDGENNEGEGENNGGNENQEGSGEGTGEGTGEGENQEGTGNENENNPDEDNTPKNYSVTVLDSNGAPVTGPIIKLYDTTGQRVTMATTKTDGKATFKNQAIGNYTFDITSNLPGIDYYYDAELCVLSPENFEVTITVYVKLASKTEVVFGEGIESDNGAKAYKVSPGVYALKASKGMTYLVFEPNRSGIFSVTVEGDANITVGNYGNPMNVLTFSTTNPDMLLENGFKVEVPPMSGDSYTLYAIGISSDVAVDCVLKIERISDISDNPMYKPWTELSGSAKYLNQFNVEEGKNFVSLDITDPTLKVVLGADGYYHLGSASGPIVVVKITAASDYIDSFENICATSTFGWYHFDEDGNFVKKERFNTMINDYAAICDEETGVCPLTEELAYAIQMNGEYHNWWNFKTNEHIFGDDAPFVVKDNAWLFACGTIN